MADLLLHSLAEFDEIVFALIERLDPRSILEIGSETGTFSARLVDRAARSGAEVITVEPAPAASLIAIAERSTTFHLLEGTSLDYLAEHGCHSDFVLVDGDHNWFTVKHELDGIADGWRQHGIGGAILLHDVGFPCARRDFYYAPERIPAEFLHPHRYDAGVTLDRSALVEGGGVHGAGHFAWAEHAGGPRNGVRTAIDDFVAEHPEFVYFEIDAVFGLGGLAITGTPAAAALEQVFAPYRNALVGRLERNRLELYLRVLELQDELAARDAEDPSTAVPHTATARPTAQEPAHTPSSPTPESCQQTRLGSRPIRPAGL